MPTTRVFIYGLLFGGAIGSATALLLAPRSGRRTRQELQSCADELAESVDLQANRLANQVAELPARLKKGVRNLATQARHKVEDSAERAGDAIDATENVLTEALA